MQLRYWTAALNSLMFIALVGIGPTSVLADDGVLRFGGYGGTLLEGQKAFIGEPFEALTGAEIQWTPSNQQILANKLLAAAGESPPFDVVLLDEPWYSVARVRGVIEELDPAKVPNLENVKSEFLVPNNEGVCLFSFTLGIVYNKEKFSENGIPAPERWVDLANPKLSGHVGTQTLGSSAPKQMLAAFAIEQGDPPTKWDRAIDEVAKIKFHSFSAGVADLMAKMEAGEVWAAPIANGRAYSMIEKGLPFEFVMPENGDGTKGGLACTVISIAKGSPNKALAEKFINFALSPAVQLMQATDETPYGPVIPDLDRILEQAPLINAKIPWGEQTKGGLRLTWDSDALEKFPQYIDAWNRKVQK